MCYYAACHLSLSVDMLYDIILSVIMLSVIAQRIIILSVIMMSVIVLVPLCRVISF